MRSANQTNTNPKGKTENNTSKYSAPSDTERAKDGDINDLMGKFLEKIGKTKNEWDRLLNS